jgi:hypothetical protein
MNYLQLTRRLWTEAGMQGAGPVTSVDAVSTEGKCFNWIKEAWVDLQVARPWRFMGSTLSFSTAADAKLYTPSGIELVRSVLAQPAFLTGVDVSARLPWITNAEWSDKYRMVSNTRAPTAICLRPDGSIALDSVGDGYTVMFDYQRTPQEMENDADIPIMGSADHMAIVWLALMRYSAHDAAGELYQTAQANYQVAFKRMEDVYLDPITFASVPMA